jgi:hypothetical protein
MYVAIADPANNSEKREAARTSLNVFMSGDGSGCDGAGHGRRTEALVITNKILR